MKVEKELFEKKLEALKNKKNVRHDVDLDSNSLKQLVGEFKKIVKSKSIIYKKTSVKTSTINKMVLEKKEFPLFLEFSLASVQELDLS